MNEPKLCIKCKYSTASLRCSHPKSLFYSDAVTGEQHYTTYYDMRRNSTCYPAGKECGKEGRYFKPEESLLRMFLNWIRKKKD